MKKYTLILFVALVFLSACGLQNTSEQVSTFEECVATGNPIMESYPRQCNYNGQNFVEKLEETACGKEFKPVCGKVEVQCVKAPCPPLAITFENRCEAEKEGATNLTEGACVDEKINPEGVCLSFDGNWLEESQECEGMNPGQCTDLGGTSNECASACRNNPDAEICTLQCVLVCQFNN